MLFNGDAGAERSRSFRGIKDNCREIAMLPALTQRAIDLSHHRNIENVERRPCESNARDAILNLESDILKFHAVWIDAYSPAGSVTTGVFKYFAKNVT